MSMKFTPLAWIFTRTSPGPGLGLSISKQIVDAHKGAIKAHNREDRSGAVFTVVLPRARK